MRFAGADAELPGPGLNAPAAVVLDGRVHLIGGFDTTTNIPRAAVDIYDPRTRTWEAHDFGAVGIFDPATDAWTAGPAIDPRATVGAAVHCGSLHVFGGESQARRRVLADVLRLDPHAGWQPVAPLPTARNFARAVVFRGAVHVVGGSLDVQVSHAPAGSAVVEALACPGGT